MAIFEQEIELARTAGVSHPDNFPFLLQPEQSIGYGALLVHGFCATPHEMRALGEHLCAQGFIVFGVRLPGHGTTPEDLAERRAEEWLAAVERGYSLLKEYDVPICGVGLSTGTLLLLRLCLLQPLTALVLLSPYLQLRHQLSPFANLLSHLIPYQHRSISTSEQDYYYQRRPLKGIAQLNRLRRQVQDILQQIQTPTLVLAAKGDTTITAGTSERIFNNLSSKTKDFHLYGTEAPHVLTDHESPCREDVFQRTAKFLKTQCVSE